MRADYYDNTSSRRHQAILSSFVSKGNDGGAEGGKLVVLGGRGWRGGVAAAGVAPAVVSSADLQHCSTDATP
jgi:hypothetical protein